MSDNRQTVENGAGRPRNGRRENGRAACAGVFADYVQNNCESLTYADIRQRRAVVQYGGGVTEVFELIEEGR